MSEQLVRVRDDEGELTDSESRRAPDGNGHRPAIAAGRTDYDANAEAAKNNGHKAAKNNGHAAPSNGYVATNNGHAAAEAGSLSGETDSSGEGAGEAPKPHKVRRVLVLIAAAVLVALLLVLGIVPRLRRTEATEASAEGRRDALPIVNFVRLEQAPDASNIILPGTTEAVEETVVSARTSGFISRRLVDIGDRVRAGQLLAEIDTPELDQQLLQARQELVSAGQIVSQARQVLNQTLQNVNLARQGLNQGRATLDQTRASLRQAQTNRELANVTYGRSANLVRQGIVSRQETDERRAELDARGADVGVAEANIRDRQANISGQQAIIEARLADVEAQRAVVRAREADVGAQQANVQRLIELRSFKRVVAPFSGVIVRRNIDTGSLVTLAGGTTNNTGMNGAGAAGGAAGNADAAGLFRIARLDAIRTYVNVPQTYAAAITPGLIAEVEVRELPQNRFEGRVTRTASALDPASRTLPTEVLIGNGDGRLLPGMYVQIRFSVPRAVRPVLIPASALVTRAEGTRVIVIRPDSTTHYQPVEVGRDYGSRLEITGGLNAGEMVVTTPTDALQEGGRVEARPAPTPPPSGNSEGGGRTGGASQSNNGAPSGGGGRQ